MALLTLGINHRTAPIELRERVAFTPERMSEAFVELRAASGASEAAILSTCNRTELYLAGDADCAPLVLRWLAGFHDQIWQILRKKSLEAARSVLRE